MNSDPFGKHFKQDTEDLSRQEKRFSDERKKTWEQQWSGKHSKSSSSKAAGDRERRLANLPPPPPPPRSRHQDRDRDRDRDAIRLRANPDPDDNNDNHQWLTLPAYNDGHNVNKDKSMACSLIGRHRGLQDRKGTVDLPLFL